MGCVPASHTVPECLHARGICVVCHVAGGTALAQVHVARNQTTLVAPLLDCASQRILLHADVTAVALYIVLQAGGPQEPRAPQA